MKLTDKERRFFELATTGGLELSAAYAKAYGIKGKSLATLISRKKKTRKDLFDAIYDHKQKLFEDAKNTQRKVLHETDKKNLLTLIEKREILKTIISGNAKQDKVVVIDSEVYTVSHGPSFADIIKSIQIDNDMAGHNAPSEIKPILNGDSFYDLLKATSAKLFPYTQGSSSRTTNARISLPPDND